MAQHIGLLIINENGETTEDSHLNVAPVYNHIQNLDSANGKYKWMVTIDAYGDSCFNHLQATFLSEELISLQKEVDNEALIKVIDKILSFISKITPHTFIKFIGD